MLLIFILESRHSDMADSIMKHMGRGDILLTLVTPSFLAGLERGQGQKQLKIKRGYDERLEQKWKKKKIGKFLHGAYPTERQPETEKQ